MIERLRNMSKKTLITTLFIVIVIIVLIIFLSNWVQNLGSGKSFKAIQESMVTAAENYASDNDSVLPTEELETVTIDVNTLVNGQYIKSLENINKNTIGCSGKINITKVREEYVYKAYLICEDNYKSLKDAVLSQEIVTSEDGLYEMNNMYVYRGENVNNYIKIGENLWRIVDIDKDGNIKVLADFKVDSYTWDDRYNSETGYNSGITNFNVSRVKDTLNNLFYNFTYIPKTFSDNVKNTTWCVGSRTLVETDKSNSSECSKLSEEIPFGLLTVSEYMRVSLDEGCIQTDSPECMNYNFLDSYNSSWWTLTPKTLGKSKIYYVSSMIEEANASSNKKLRISFVLKDTTLIVGGTGTKENPYVFE